MRSSKTIQRIRMGKLDMRLAQLRHQREESMRLPPTYFCENSDTEPYMGSLGFVALTQKYPVSVYADGHLNLHSAWSELATKAVFGTRLFPNAICWYKNELDGRFYAQAYAWRD